MLESLVSQRSILAASALSVVEVRRAAGLASAAEEVLAEADRLLASLDLAEISKAVLNRAAELSTAELRSLGAIHLATAERLGAQELVTYDRRLGVAAEGLGMSVLSPGS